MEFLQRYALLVIAVFVGIVSGGLALSGSGDVARIVLTIHGVLMGTYMLVGMVRNLLHGKLGVDILAVTAIYSTAAVGEYWATFVIVMMTLIGTSLEAYANNRAKRELTALLERAPKKARIEKDGRVVEVPINEIKVGDRVLLSPGGVVPVDGRIVEGEGEVDESSLTGESEPVEVKVGDALMSGSVNGETALVLHATATAGNSQYAQIVELVRAAGDSRAPFVRMADRYAVPFTAVSFGIAFLGWALSGDVRRFVEVLVVATPCPLLLAAPIALISGMSRAAKHGIILKSGAVLEQLSRVKTAAFDKTGTLTKNHLEFAGLESSGVVSDDELLRIAAIAEQESVHMTAVVILEEARRRKLDIPEVANIRETPGKGIEVNIEGGHVLAGRLDFLESQHVHIGQASRSGKTATHISRDGIYLGAVLFADAVRENSKETLDKLRAMGIKNLVMLTGDYQQTAESIANTVGITEVHAQCLPKDKLELVRDMKDRPVMMVGDGVNDAPVLAASDIGVAMGAKGATAASESADAVIMLDDISRVSLVVSIAKRAIRIAKQSVFVGIGLSVGLMVIASFGLLPAVVGAGLQELVDFVVIVNALRAHKGAWIGVHK